MILLYVSVLSCILIGYLFYMHVLTLEWEENERRRMDSIALHLGILLRLLEAPDVKFLLYSRATRKGLFLDFSAFIRRDVTDLLRLRALNFEAAVYLVVFLFFYYLLRIKARLVCGEQDLKFLSMLGLVLFRSLHPEEARP